MIEDGIYLNLPNADYHADTALGSTGLKRLLTSAEHYWWHSPLNPQCEAKDTPAMLIGRAYHALVCEGAPAFAGRLSFLPFWRAGQETAIGEIK